ncbi:MAG: hypothetical protein L0H21_07575 [Tetragenococcus koreensis]|nr:hypothetical protein [Tetragenococcus koreensis]
MSGFVIEQLERVPETNDSFTFDNLYVTVTNAQKRRVNEVLVEKIDSAENS